MTMPTDGIKISQLSSISTSKPADVYPMVQDGVTQKANPALLSTDYKSLAVLPSSIVYNGQRSYDITFTSVNYGGILSPGMRLATQRTVAAPTNSTSLNGTNQYWRNTSPNKMAWTDDFAAGVWIKPTAYQANSFIMSRFNGTSGWEIHLGALGTVDGRVQVTGYNAGGGNYSAVISYQSVQLNRWTHISGQLDMSAFTATATTSYIMIDGIDVPAFVTRGGSNPTSLIQAGDLVIGAGSTGPVNFFPGKIAQAAVFNSKVTQATMRGYMSQGYTGTEANLASAYSFDNNANDLNTTTPNNLTAANAAGYIAESPFGTQASGSISSTLDYGIIMSVSGGTNTTITVQVPEGCTIPTSGGVSGVSYSGIKSPYGFPSETERWAVTSLYLFDSGTSGAEGTVVWLRAALGLPVGAWDISTRGAIFVTSAGNALNVSIDLNTSPSSSPTIGAYSLFREAIYDVATGASNRETMSLQRAQASVKLSAFTTYNMFARSNGVTASSLSIRGDFTPFNITARNAYL